MRRPATERLTRRRTPALGYPTGIKGRYQAAATIVGTGGGDDERVYLGHGRQGWVQHRILRAPLRRLLAFYDQQEEGLLVLEFAANENLHERLHGSGKAVAMMLWERRVLFARALEYLHNRCELQVVHDDIKASNVLLNAAMSTKLCDLESTRMGFSAAVRLRSSVHTMFGSPGYMDPHYIHSGVVTKKSDVYSFGVLRRREPQPPAVHG